MMARELRIHYHTRADLPPLDCSQALESPRDAAKVFAALLDNEPVEVLVALMLTVRHRPIGFHEVGRGSLTSVIAEPREVFKAAFLANAGAVIVSHNHPSGDPQPSREDLALTQRLASAGVLLGVPVLDHIVIGAGTSYFSFRESGLLAGL